MFENRLDGANQLADLLLQNKVGKTLENVVVLGIPRGGVITAGFVSQKLNCPIDIIVTKKLVFRANTELAVGAVGKTIQSLYLNKKLIAELNIDQQYLNEQIGKQQQEIERRENLYRQGKKPLDLFDKTVVIVDDGAATGATVISAAREVWRQKPKRVIIALPVASLDTQKILEKEADEVEVVLNPDLFFSVNQAYEEFPQVSDMQVIELLNNNNVIPNRLKAGLEIHTDKLFK